MCAVLQTVVFMKLVAASVDILRRLQGSTLSFSVQSVAVGP